MKLLDMIFRRDTDDEPETPEAPTVPDRTSDIIRQTVEHVRATRGAVEAGVLTQQDERVKKAFEATGRAIRSRR